MSVSSIMQPPAMSPSDRAGTSVQAFARLPNLFVGVVYLLTFRQVYWSYISVEWGYTGLVYRDLTALQTIFMYGAVMIVSWFVPQRFARPSTVIIWFLYALVYVPTMAIAMMTGLYDGNTYLGVLTALSAGMILICTVTDRHEMTESRNVQPSINFVQITVAIFIVATFVIVYAFREIMSFASIDDVYVQRFVAADMTSGVMGYIRTYYGSLLAPLLITMGIATRSRFPLILLGSAGFLISYMVDASKISLVIPIAMVIAGYVFRWSHIRLYHFTGAMIVLCLVSTALTTSTRFVRFIADLVLLRTISIPAQTFTQYFDVFYSKGYTWWSNVTGLNLILPVPTAFRADQFWPVLGQIVGAEYYGFNSRVNLNANPFVGEGVAAGGWVGILVISLAIALFLKALDHLSRDWDRRLALVAMVPIGLTLTNVHLSTFLVSFGGLAWLAFFGLYRPDGSRRKVAE